MNVWLCRVSAEVLRRTEAAVTSRNQMPTETMQVINMMLVAPYE
jgi:hypothetical protein